MRSEGCAAAAAWLGADCSLSLTDDEDEEEEDEPVEEEEEEDEDAEDAEDEEEEPPATAPLLVSRMTLLWSSLFRCDKRDTSET